MKTRAQLTRLTAVIGILLLAGCVGGGNNLAPERNVPERLSMPAPAPDQPAPSEGSIFGRRYRNLYDDDRARHVGDIILVKIVENSSGKKSVNTKTSRDSSITGGISSLFGYENKWLTGPKGTHSPSLTSLKGKLAKDFEGKGDTDRSSTVTATISARVVDVTMDGNLKIRGYREVKVNNETQHIILSGIVRPEDIGTDNSILSTYVADARIEYSGVGSLSSKQQPGWLANAIDVLWPF